MRSMRIASAPRPASGQRKPMAKAGMAISICFSIVRTGTCSGSGAPQHRSNCGFFPAGVSLRACSMMEAASTSPMTQTMRFEGS